MVPFVCVIIGCLINGIDFSQKSPLVLVEPSLFPTPQRITLNINAVDPLSDVSTTTLYDNLPGVTGTDWEVTYKPSGSSSFVYYNSVNASRTDGEP